MRSSWSAPLSVVAASAALSLVAAAGCAAPARRGPPPADAGTVARARAPLALPLAAVTVRGELAVRRAPDGAWEPLAAGASVTGASAVRATRRGAIVALGDGAAAPLVYLRAGAEVALAQDDEGVHVGVTAGRVRVRRGATVRTLVATAAGAVTVAQDVLVDAGPRSAADVVPTGARPDAAAWSVALAQPDAEAGIGRMEAAAAADRLDPLALRAVAVDVRTAGDLAVTEVTHVFHNAADERREGTFRFPLPDGALLVGLALEIDGKLVEGEIVERDKARRVYEKIVDEMLDPALLEWEQGNWFKLRVFPLEPRADKRVVIRYVTALERAATGWAYAYAATAPAGARIGELAVTVDGAPVLAQRDLAGGVDLVVPVPAARVPAVMREARADAVYTAVRIMPTASALAGAQLATATMAPAGGRRLAIVFDTSRSTLEGRAQALEVLATTLRQLAPTDRFVVLASDVVIAPSADAFVPVTEPAIAAALAHVAAIEPDGASDLGAALAAVDARDPTDVVYIGDGIPTWGEQRPAALGALADRIGAPIAAALIGKGASTALWGELAGRTGGQAMLVRSRADEQRFALAATAAAAPRLIAARVSVPGAGPGTSVFPAHASTLFAGDELVAVVRTPAGEPPPAAVRLTGTVGGAPFSEDVPLTGAVITPRVAQRWARHQLAALEAADAPREDIVALSTALGVMSTHTSLLVLENDEAYRQHQIARRQAQAQQQLAAGPAAPQVTGGDLDTLGARQASLSPDEIQPGDPEIKIPAPRDARTVVVSFPFGETKLAAWDEDQAAWMVRFLIDQATADGVYQVRVTITHADGRLEVLTLPYTVDTRAPRVEVTATRAGAGYRLVARQVADGEKRRDADRVEVTLPDGEVLRLRMTAWGRFEGRWTPAAPLPGPVTLTVVARDNALNQATSALVIPPVAP